MNINPHIDFDRWLTKLRPFSFIFHRLLGGHKCMEIYYHLQQSEGPLMKPRFRSRRDRWCCLAHFWEGGHCQEGSCRSHVSNLHFLASSKITVCFPSAAFCITIPLRVREKERFAYSQEISVSFTIKIKTWGRQPFFVVLQFWRGKNVWIRVLWTFPSTEAFNEIIDGRIETGCE